MTIGSCLQKVLGVSVCLLMLPSLAAGSTIIGQVSGTINLQLYPFHDTRPENTADGWVDVPNPGQYHTGNVALLDVSESIDGSGYYSTGGLSRIDYTPVQNTAGAAVLDIHTVADTLGRGDGGGGDASLNIQITFSQPVFYRFEAQAIGAPYQYEVSFNGRYADAWYDAFGTYGGSFPLIYHPESCSAVGWDTYVDQGTLPAGTYNLSVAAFSALNRYGDGNSSEGTARLLSLIHI